MKKSITSQTYISSLIYLLCGVMVFLLTLSVNTIYASAEGSNSLPYVVEENLYLSYDDFVSIWETQAKLDGASDSWLTQFHWDSDNVIGYSVLNDGRLLYTYFYVPMDNSSYSLTLSSNYSSFDVNNDYITINFSNYCLFMFITDNNNTSYYNRYYNSNTQYFLGSYNTPLYISSDFYLLDDVVLSLPVSDPVVNHGHATPPINNNGHYIPTPHPNKPTPTTYTPPSPNFPTIDTSTLEKLVESLIDVVEYGFSYTGSVISGWFNNLISNVSDYLEYISEILISGFNNVVGSIQDFATDFYNNMVSLFEPIYDFFSGVANFFNSLIELGMVNGEFSFGTFISKLIVPDVSDVVDLLTDNDAFGSHALFLASYHKIQFLINTFNNLQPIKVFTVPSTTWHGYTIGGFTVDFSWYDNFKVYMDLILSGFLIIGYLYWLFSSLNSLFRGTGSMVYDSLYEPQTKGGDHH